jgi:hypothetical protein
MRSGALNRSPASSTSGHKMRSSAAATFVAFLIQSPERAVRQFARRVIRPMHPTDSSD